MPTTTMTTPDTCHRCGTKLPEREIPADFNARMAEMLARLPRHCDPCVKELQAEEAEEAERERAEEAARLLASRRDQAEMPRELAAITFDDIDVDDDNREAVEAARAWGKGELTGLLLGGNVGVGKTWLAAAAVNERLHLRRVRWFSVARLMAQARAGFGASAREELNDVLLNGRLALVLDDIDKANPTDYTREILFELIDERINEGTPLIVTTNRSGKELKKIYGEPILSRLIKHCTWCKIEGGDRRRKAA